jgi:hypothetical protein
MGHARTNLDPGPDPNPAQLKRQQGAEPLFLGTLVALDFARE